MANKPIDPVKTCSDHASKAPEDCCKQVIRKEADAMAYTKQGWVVKKIVSYKEA